MTKKLLAVGLLVLAPGALLITGCQTAGGSSETAIYGMKGRPSDQERARYTDDKGRFHLDAYQAGTPLR